MGTHELTIPNPVSQLADLLSIYQPSRTEYYKGNRMDEELKARHFMKGNDRSTQIAFIIKEKMKIFYFLLFLFMTLPAPLTSLSICNKIGAAC